MSNNCEFWLNEGEGKRYKVKTEVIFHICAQCEADAIEEADSLLAETGTCDPSGYYEVEEVSI